MIKNEVKIKRNFDTRSAALFVQLAGNFETNVKIELGNKKTSCKSLMGVISLGVLEGQNVILTAEGADAETAVKELCGFLEADEVS